MSDGVFITGTGTEVGKSVVAAVIAAEAVAAARRVAVFKPAVSGLEESGEADHELLRRASRSAQSDDEIAPYRYQPSVSPHLAAELAGERVEPERLLVAAATAATKGDVLICEGVGGLLVPLGGRYLIRDFAVQLGYPLIVVATPGLGTINHTLLTLEAARSTGLDVRAVVINLWPGKPSAMERSNRETIAELGEVEVLTLSQIDLAEPEGWPSLGLLDGASSN